MRVIAVAIGYDNIVVRQPGDEFDMPEGATGSWFMPAAGEQDESPVEPAPAAAKPRHVVHRRKPDADMT